MKCKYPPCPNETQGKALYCSNKHRQAYYRLNQQAKALLSIMNDIDYNRALEIVTALLELKNDT